MKHAGSSLVPSSFAAGIALATVLLLSACGFQLRGSYSLPYESIYLSVADYSLIGAGLKRAIRASGSTRIADTADDAQAVFLPTTEAKESIILSLSSSGRVREKLLRYRYGYRIADNKGRNLVPPNVVELTRTVTYADSDVLAKTQEEDLLWRDMETDLVQQLMRRLAATKPTPPKPE